MNQVINYFRDCYKEDNSRTVLTDLYHKSVSHQIVIDGSEEILSGFMPRVPINATAAEAAAGAAYTYRMERDLIYCSLLVAGKLDTGENRPDWICAPLLLHPVEIVDQSSGVAFAGVNVESRQVNQGILEMLPYEGDPALADQVGALVGAGPLTPSEITPLAHLLEQRVIGMNVDLCSDYPRLMSEDELKKRLRSLKRRREHCLELLPVSMVALVRRSREARGVLNELEAMAGDSLSEPLQIMLGQEVTTGKQAHLQIGRIPAVLSDAQTRILDSGARNLLSLLIGPPGTGKSFTIAALAVEHLARNESVLIVSKMNHAVDVVGSKIEELLGFGGCVVRGGRRQYAKELKIYLKQLLSGMVTDHMSSGDVRKQIKQARLDLVRLDKTITRTEREIKNLGVQEMGWGPLLADQDPGLFKQLRQRVAGFRASLRQPLWNLINNLEIHLEHRIEKARHLISRINQLRLQGVLHKHRKSLVSFSKGISARTGGRQLEHFSQVDFDALLGAFPIWAVNLADLYEVLPLHKGLFDLMIIDEATQCDIASCLPAVERAKRVVITGDPQQLRHISFLSRERQNRFASERQLDDTQRALFNYRDSSILDLANEVTVNQDQVIFLDEHFRSEPDIINFSNRRFYNNKLHIMTHKPDAGRPKALRLVQGMGGRNSRGANPEEGERLLASLIERLETYHPGDNLPAPSIGILSPFRGQVDWLVEQVSERLTTSVMQRHRILIGTAHAFQGEERDIMYLSFALDDQAHPTARRYMERPDVFNVSITRARTLQEIHISLDPNCLPADSLLRDYLDHVQQQQPAAGRNQRTSLTCSEGKNLLQALQEKGYGIIPAFPMAGLVMDLVITHQNRHLALDLVGWPGEYETFIPLERYKMLGRAGTRLFSLPYSKWVADARSCLEAIDSALGWKM